MKRWPYLIGAALQGLLLGMLVLAAIVVLLGFDADARLFRYQGY
jgi:hypothetical protein